MELGVQLVYDANDKSVVWCSFTSLGVVETSYTELIGVT